MAKIKIKARAKARFEQEQASYEARMARTGNGRDVMMYMNIFIIPKTDDGKIKKARPNETVITQSYNF